MQSIDQAPDLLQAAISYAARGWRVFPLAPQSKRPFFKHWPWQEAATEQLKYVEQWWKRYPNCNIAVVADDKFTGVDVDRKDPNADGWLAVGNEIDQRTVWAATPNNGYHFYYQAVPERLHKLPGVDIQTGHKYLVAPPSRLGVGPYQWGNALGAPWDSGILPMPEALKARLLDFSPTNEDHTDNPGLLETFPTLPLEDMKPFQLLVLQRNEVTVKPSRSELVMSLCTRLYRLGYQDAEVMSMLWDNPYVQDTGLEHRQGDYHGALDWLWDTCKKTRHQRKKEVHEVFAPVSAEPTKRVADFQSLLADAQRLLPGADCRPILQEVALVELDPFEEDQLVGVLKSQGHTKSVITKILKEYKGRAAKQNDIHGISWKHTTGDDNRPLGTVENLKALLDSLGTKARHNLMDHRVYLEGKNFLSTGEERLNTQLSQVRSWAQQHRMPLETVKEQLVMLAEKDEYHPFKEYVEATTWDGTVRLTQVLETIQVAPDKRRMRDLLVTRWLLSIVASVWGYGNRPPRGVLTFTGQQQQGKTTWLYYLVPRGMYHQGLILRPDQRDSATKGLRFLVVEIGEIGTTFKRSDIEALKAYIGQREDVYRLSYAHDESIWKRRTVFAASANNQELLHDQTGNTRWWVLETLGFDLNAMESLWEGSGLQQFWAEMYLRYKNGETWDLSDSELTNLEDHLKDHMEMSPLGSALQDTYDWDEEPPKKGYPVPKREIDINRELRWGRPFNPSESRELREMLKKWTGDRQGRLRRVSLATVDGKTVSNDWRKELEDPTRPGYTRPGRYWYLPAMRGEAEAQPFKPVK